MKAQIISFTGKPAARPQTRPPLKLVEAPAHPRPEEEPRIKHGPWVTEKMRDAIRQYRYIFSPEELLTLLEEAVAAERRMIERSK